MDDGQQMHSLMSPREATMKLHSTNEDFEKDIMSRTTRHNTSNVEGQKHPKWNKESNNQHPHYKMNSTDRGPYANSLDRSPLNNNNG